MNNNIARVNMVLDSFNIDTLQCSQGDTEGREFGFRLMDGDTDVDISNIVDPVFREFDVYKNGTEEVLPSALMNGVVDLGSLDWNYVTSWGSGNVFSSVQSITGAKTVGLSQVSNILCSRYITVSRNDNYSNYTTGSISMNDQGLVQIRDSFFSNASAFKSAMSGVLLYYEKTNSTPATSPIIADIKYPQGELTDQEFLYRESPTQKDGIAKLTRIKGNTLTFNQLIINGNFADTSGWNKPNVTFSVSNNVGTMKASARYGNLSQSLTGIPSGHKCIAIATIKSYINSATKFLFRTVLDGSVRTAREVILSTTEQTYTLELTTDTNSYVQYVIEDQNTSGWGNITVKNAMAIDLTRMFGQGKEPTLEQFRTLFPLPYYPYQSTLLPFKGNAIKTVGKNLLTYSVPSLATNGITFTPQSDGSVSISGTATGNAYFNLYTWVTTTELLPRGKQLRISGGSSNTKFTVGYRNTDGTGTVLGEDFGNGASITIPVGEYQIYVAYRVLSGVTINETSRPMVRFSDADLTYEPYTSSATDLPISRYFPSGMKRAGNVYDELLPNKAITRVGEVDASSNWSYPSVTSAGGLKYVELNDSTIKIDGEGLCNLLGVDNSTAWASTVPVVQISTSANRIRVYGNFSSLEDFQSQYANIKIFYELATETETDVNTATLVTERGEIPLYRFGSRLYGDCTKAVSKHPGIIDGKIRLINSDGVAYSNKVMIRIERSTK